MKQFLVLTRRTVARTIAEVLSGNTQDGQGSLPNRKSAGRGISGASVLAGSSINCCWMCLEGMVQISLLLDVTLFICYYGTTLLKYCAHLRRL